MLKHNANHESDYFALLTKRSINNKVTLPPIHYHSYLFSVTTTDLLVPMSYDVVSPFVRLNGLKSPRSYVEQL